MQLYGFWRSVATFRVRAALNLKGLAFEETMIDLDAGEQHAAAYRALNPAGAVPTLIEDDGSRLRQSLAILEYLEETHPAPALLPASPRARARVRAIALGYAADHHPLIVPRVRSYLRDVCGLDEAARTGWVRHWFAEGLAAGEALLAGHPDTGRFCHGDAPTIADLCLISQVAGARGFQIDLAPYPVTAGIYDAGMAIDAIARAHPLRQPGAPTGS
jgi:maleylacetoacetate isomerase